MFRVGGDWSPRVLYDLLGFWCEVQHGPVCTKLYARVKSDMVLDVERCVQDYVRRDYVIMSVQKWYSVCTSGASFIAATYDFVTVDNSSKI